MGVNEGSLQVIDIYCRGNECHMQNPRWPSLLYCLKCCSRDLGKQRCEDGTKQTYRMIQKIETLSRGTRERAESGRLLCLNQVKVTSSNTTDRACHCLHTTRRYRHKTEFVQSVLHQPWKHGKPSAILKKRRTNLTQFSVEKEPSLVDDAPLALLFSLFLSRGRLQALLSVLACVHGPTYPLVFFPSPLPLCFFVRYTCSFVMHPGSGLCFFTIEASTTPFARRRPLLYPCRRVQPTHRVHWVHTSFWPQCHLPPRTHRIA